MTLLGIEGPSAEGTLKISDVALRVGGYGKKPGATGASGAGSARVAGSFGSVPARLLAPVAPGSRGSCSLSYPYYSQGDSGGATMVQTQSIEKVESLAATGESIN